MIKQQLLRRIVLGALAVTLALPGLEVVAEGQPFADDIASGAQMKGICEENGGDFTDTEDGNLWCQWDDGSQTVFDTDGQDCYDIPAWTPPTDRLDPALGLDPVMFDAADQDRVPAGPAGGQSAGDRALVTEPADASFVAPAEEVIDPPADEPAAEQGVLPSQESSAELSAAEDAVTLDEQP
jgi:hypothetical protein